MESPFSLMRAAVSRGVRVGMEEEKQPPVRLQDMRFFGRFRYLFYAMTVLSVLSFALTESSGNTTSPGIYMFAIAGILGSWFLVDATRQKIFPRWAVNLGVLFSSFVLFWELVVTEQKNLLFALGHFMICILICKLFEQRSPRDFGQILTLSLLVIISAAIFSTSLAFGIIMAAYLALGLIGIVLFYLHRQLHHQAARTLMKAGPKGPPQANIYSDLFHVITSSWVIVICSAALVFMAFPRGIGREVFGAFSGNGASAFTGFSDHVQFGEIRKLQQSDVPVMEVRMEYNGLAFGSPYVEPYFRGLVLDRYDASTHSWQRSRGDSLDSFGDARELTDTPKRLVPRSTYDTGSLVMQHYVMRGPNPGHILFNIYPAVTIASNDVRAYSYDRQDHTLAARTVRSENFAYDIESPLRYSPEIAPLGVFDNVIEFIRHGQTESHQDDPIPPFVKTKADEVTADVRKETGSAPTPDRIRRLAGAVESYLRNHYPYSLESVVVDRSLDPTEDFLKNRQRTGGHCEYFASAMVMMCRSEGLQARMVTGYHGGEYNNVGGYYLVRQKNAHAWAEVYIPTVGWEKYDPSPAAGAVPIDPNSWTMWAVQVAQFIEKTWLSSVVLFDDHNRKAIGSFLYRNVGVYLVSIAQEAKIVALALWNEALTSPFGMVRLGLVVALTLAIGSVVVREIGKLMGRQINVQRAARKQAKRDRVIRQRELSFLGLLLQVLRRAGIRRVASQTPREVILRLKEPAARDDAAWLVDLFYELRFGGKRLTEAMDQQVHLRLDRLTQSLRRPGK